MKVTALCLLLMIEFVDSDETTVSVTVFPERLQFFKYEHFSVSCEDKEGKKEVAGWKVMMKMEEEEVCSRQPPYFVSAAFPTSDSGVYWCETELGATSNDINITVTDGLVILKSPVHPVTEGVNLTLSCACKAEASKCNLPVNFYKDGKLINSSSTGNMTLLSVSRSDQGLYKCNISGSGDSPESWLTVKVPPAGEDPPMPQVSVSTLVRHLVVGAPYLISTVLLGLIYKDRKREKRDQDIQTRHTSNEVLMQIIT
ncbi:high affinity immunoglobulin gamma Fc receptor I-like [Melanotaenia boesemani]|uniref:high affinity immunoglobulin gamma Fc receptor I-like n=1 Tax=Melanotaenia boesemani TaxID=1250792 RepID=UPI001C054B80|nr:high affinity immunoglobulin gamma Fc receptor I-like [Melanotaenia boesemani]XP_041841231.1 high affinity immunoglobulin gamma Fc receptor I-like [Melanotaenia boesemani]